MPVESGSIMKRDFIKSILKGVRVCLAAVCLALGGYSAATADSFRPDWDVGDRWFVKAVQRMPAAGDEWSEPIVWEYSVTARENMGDEWLYIVDVTQRSGDGSHYARLWYRCEDQTLAKIEISSGRNSMKRTMELAFDDPVPVCTERSIIPFDNPVFSDEIPIISHYELIRDIGGNFFKKVDLKQEAKFFSGKVAICPWVERDDLLEIRCTQGENVKFVQYWEKGRPWAVCGDNGCVRYWMVEE